MNSSPFNWSHAVACLLVAATAVLLCFGALVTTFDAAMAVPDWPATSGHNLFLCPWAEWFYGPWDLFLEHGHRLLGACVGMISLVLAAVVWRSRASTVVRALAVAAVLLVVVQGVLGGARVLLDDKTVAKVHACTGPLFFAVAVAMATLTRRPWSGQAVEASAASPAAWRSAAALAIASYVQLVAGAQLRHLDASVDPATFRWLVVFHLVGAAAVAVLATTAVLFTRTGEVGSARGWSRAILFLVVCQLALGCGAWIGNWGLPNGWLPTSWAFSDPLVARSVWGASVVTGHVVLGMLILGAAVVLAIASGVLLPAAGAAAGLRVDRSRERAFA
ncbi:MAG: COX15/CtaA family protein [Planctomycetia bacterium]